jgi:isoquinoline 1-oxidoreductase beta subunit
MKPRFTGKTYHNAGVPDAVVAAAVSGAVADADEPAMAALHRPVGYIPNAFMHETLIDEVAVAGSADPLALRRKLMAPYPVATRLIDTIELMSDWATPLPEGKARGFAFTLSFGTWVAEVVQIAQETAGIRIEKVFCAADAGLVLDDRNFRMLMKSGIVSGLSAAIGRDIAMGENAADYDGRYRSPEIEVELLSNSRYRGEADEPAAPPVMSALANAIFALTGKRVRQMPFCDEVRFV